MPLTDQQVEKLFEFTRKKYVYFYDLQVELVDHLAESIEYAMEKDPSLSFEAALEKVYKTFGIFGFGKIVQQKSEALYKQSKWMWWQEFKNFLTIPKVFLTLTVAAAALILGQLLPEEVRGIVVLIFWFTISIVEARNYYKQKRKARKQLMLTQYANHASTGSFMIPYWVIVPAEIGWLWIFVLLITFVFISEMAIIEVNKKVREQAYKLYPEAFA